MLPLAISSSTSLSEEASVSSGSRLQDFGGLYPIISTFSTQPQLKTKKKRSLPGNPDPDAEVLALSPKTLLATNRFVCEICNKGFQRDQNLQLHRRGHNLPWKLKQRNIKQIKKRAYVCPEPTCVHHHPSRALGDLTGVKKHYSRKHGEKKWKCEKCCKMYAVQSDWKVHSKTCGTREYRCDCGTLFTRKDSFITHKAFCDALAEESARLLATHHQLIISSTNPSSSQPLFLQDPPLTPPQPNHFPSSLLLPLPSHNSWDHPHAQNPTQPNSNAITLINPPPHFQIPPPSSLPFHHQDQHATSAFQGLPMPARSATPSMHLSATALPQKAVNVGHQRGGGPNMTCQLDLGVSTAFDRIGRLATWQKCSEGLTRDFLGLTDENSNMGGGNGAGGNVREVLTYGGGVGFPHCFGYVNPPPPSPPPSEAWGDC